MAKDPREEFDALFRGKEDGDYDYLAPMLECDHCGKVMWLPYGSLPQSDEEGMPLAGEDPLELPLGKWFATFGCIACGHIGQYAGDQVKFETVPRRSESRFHSHADLWLVRSVCGDKRCKTPFSVHVCMLDDNATAKRADAKDAIEALRRMDFFEHKLPCGHGLKTIPATFYHAERVTKRMW